MRRPDLWFAQMPILSLAAGAGVFGPEQTRAICDAFDGAWTELQRSGSELTAPASAPAAREALAKRIIDRALDGLLNVRELRDDALAYLHHNPPV
ncbi:MAG: hypothetical protein ABWY64_17490 [Tardiphaga sp.]|jgi:hypothetical protein